MAKYNVSQKWRTSAASFISQHQNEPWKVDFHGDVTLRRTKQRHIFAYWKTFTYSCYVCSFSQGNICHVKHHFKWNNDWKISTHCKRTMKYLWIFRWGTWLDRYVSNTLAITTWTLVSFLKLRALIFCTLFNVKGNNVKGKQ